MTTLRAPGRRDESLKVLRSEVAEALGGAKVHDAVRVESTRADEPPHEVRNVSDAQIVEIELEGGLRQFLRLDQFREDYGIDASRDDSGALEIPPRIGRQERSRGIASDIALKAFRLIDVPLEEGAARAVAAHFESKLSQGLRRWHADGALDEEPITSPGDLPADEPLLIFLHGTASTTLGSFDALRSESTDIWRQLRDEYDDRILGFEHPTLTSSPIDNVIKLLEALPSQARLHLVSHSRGGLVGELLCRSRVLRSGSSSNRPFDKADFAQFGEPKYQEQEKALKRLDALLREKQPRVERFVRVACPTQGTVLLAKRLDRAFSLLVNALTKTTGLDKVFLVDFATSLAMATAKERTNPETLPGIEAMVPDSALVKVLNRADIEVEADLSVIAGDIEGEGVWQRLKVFATDLFYWQDHDLVVHTQSMYGGGPRSSGARKAFEQGSHVDHFSYFRNKSSADKIHWGLRHDQGDDGDFSPLVGPAPEPIHLSALRSGEARQTVFLVPGIMGSHLSVGDERIWIDIKEIAKGRLSRLKASALGVKPDGLVERSYKALAEHLAKRYDVVLFPYDWRRSLLEEGRRLATEVDDRLRGSALPVSIVAHSMGGLLSRAMIAEREDVWGHLVERGGRLVMLGTPNGGSHTISSVLLGRDRMVRNLARLDFKNDRMEVLDIVRRFRGLLELLPSETEPHDYLSIDRWRELHQTWDQKWLPPDAPDLESAARLREALSNPATIAPENMSYIAGKAPATPISVEIDAEAKGKKRIRLMATEEGDGRVPWSTGRLPGVGTWYMDVKHGALASDSEGFDAIVDLVETGNTDRLSTTPAVVRGSTEPFEMLEEEAPAYPDEAELEGSALGFDPRAASKRTVHRIKVTVTHGDVRFSKHPVLVGHYEDDSIVGAEWALNGALDGRLQRRRDFGLYPGRIGSTELFLKPGGEPPGAIVVGLGPVGELSPGELRGTLASGLTHFAIESAELRPDISFHALTATSILVGSGQGGIPPVAALRALLEAAADANDALRGSDLADRVRFDRIELIEIHQDRAVRTAKQLHDLARQKSLRERFDLSTWHVQPGRGGFHRIAPRDDAAWWDRLQISERERDGVLEFVSLTGGTAGARAYDLPTQRTSIDAFLSRAVRTIHSDERLAKTLFQLLVPNQIKVAAPEERDLVLVVDEAAARYPWELLQDASDKAKPLSVQAGMIRQMKKSSFRENPRFSADLSAFVVGDPPTDDFAKLPGAAAEAEAAAAALEGSGFQVEKHVQQGFQNVLTGLFAHPYRVLHLAGHGVFEHVRKDPAPGSAEQKVTGMVLSDDVFLTPAEINQMLIVPELVFINCCYLGQAGSPGRHGDRDRYHHLAANLGTQLIQMGARAVIAAGWAVEDNAASDFAGTFYREMLAGARFGQAVKTAREETYDAHRATNTWGAYQCYGDPDYALLPNRRSGRARDPNLRAVVEEAVLELGNLATKASKSTDEELDHLKRRIDELSDSLPASWLKDARLLEALGKAYGEVRMFKRAVDYYEQARTRETATLSVKSLEQLANLRGRWSVDIWKQASRGVESRDASPRRVIQQAHQEIETLLSFGETRERYSLLGSARKRLAWIETGAARDRALEGMREAYEKAESLGRDKEGFLYLYPALNALAARVLIHARGTGRRLPDLDQKLDEIEKSIGVTPSEAPFFDEIGRVDVQLMRAIGHNNLGPDERERLALAYQEAQQKGKGTPKQCSSVREHLEFLYEVLGEETGRMRKTRRRELQRGLSVLLRALQASPAGS